MTVDPVIVPESDTPPSFLGISPESWDRTLPEVQAAIYALMATVSAFEAIVLRLEARISELEAQIKTNSTNSSKPPSSDPPWTKRANKKPPSGKRQGGQPGHPGNARPIVPREDVDAIVPCIPASCSGCGTNFADRDAGAPSLYRRHQVWELPQVRATVTEYELHRRRCTGCGVYTEAPLPPNVPTGAFGPRLQSELALLTGRYRMSRREACDYAASAWGIKLSLGALMRIERNVSRALESGYDEAWDAIRAAAVRNVDETGWCEKNRRAWLWAGTSTMATAFTIAETRGRKVLVDCFGDALGHGYFVTDRYGAYKGIPMERRGICHAHLHRDFKKIAQRGGYAEIVIGRPALAAYADLFALTAVWNAGLFSAGEFAERLEPIKARMHAILETGSRAGDAMTRGMCRDIRKHRSALWTFASVPGVGATNNAAERVIRPAVLWRKGSFGTQSASGSRYVERMLTVARTCVQNGRDTLAYLHDSLSAMMRGATPPRLIGAAPA